MKRIPLRDPLRFGTVDQRIPRVRWSHFTASTLLLWSIEAPAQQTDQNATRQSEDAFGTQIGSERIGLYSNNDIRGFDPVDSGNVRLENLYFDQVDMLASTFLERTRIRVGLSSQGFAFPAPSGLVDYSLNLPGREPALSVELNLQNNLDSSTTLRFGVPVVSAISLGGGAEVSHRVFSDGRASRSIEGSGVLVFTPTANSRLAAFFSAISTSDNEARPGLVPAADFLPPPIKRGKNLSQPWADQDTDTRTVGIMAHFPMRGVQFEGGVFRDRKEIQSQFADVLSGVTTEGAVGQRTIIADGLNSEQSLSGEARVTSYLSLGNIRGRITASVRGRQRHKVFGGAQRINLGPSTVLDTDVRSMPTITLGPKSADRVSQMFYGMFYRAAWGARLRFDGGLSRTSYRKTVSLPSGAMAFQASTHAWLWNASASYEVVEGLTAFGGVIRSMEEAPVAPDRATNRAESPPAIKTGQEELALRYVLGEKLTASVGLYRISKPYYNLDSGLRYRLLGYAIKQGLELSLVSSILPGLTAVGGVIIGSPRIEGEAVRSGQIGERPVGEANNRMVLNADWRLNKGQSPVSLDFGLRKESGRYSNAANTFRTPGNLTVDLGGRYRFTVSDTPLLLRIRVQNLLNSYAWSVSRSGSFMYTNPRRITAQLVADF